MYSKGSNPGSSTTLELDQRPKSNVKRWLTLGWRTWIIFLFIFYPTFNKALDHSATPPPPFLSLYEVIIKHHCVLWEKKIIPFEFRLDSPIPAKKTQNLVLCLLSFELPFN